MHNGVQDVLLRQAIPESHIVHFWDTRMARSKDFSVVPEMQAASSHAAAGSALSAQDRRVLIESVTRDLESIDAAWRGHDEAGVLERIHSLKGALFIVGEHATAHDCGVAEQFIRTQGLSACDQAMQQLKASLRRLLQRYERRA